MANYENTPYQVDLVKHDVHDVRSLIVASDGESLIVPSIGNRLSFSVPVQRGETVSLPGLCDTVESGLLQHEKYDLPAVTTQHYLGKFSVDETSRLGFSSQVMIAKKIPNDYMKTTQSIDKILQRGAQDPNLYNYVDFDMVKKLRQRIVAASAITNVNR